MFARPAIFCLNCGFFGSRALVRNLREQCRPDRPAARYNRILRDLEACRKPFTLEPLAEWAAPSADMVKDLLRARPAVDAEPVVAGDGQPGEPSVADPVAALELAVAFRAKGMQQQETAEARPGAATPLFDGNGHRVLPPLLELPPARSLRRFRFRF